MVPSSGSMEKQRSRSECGRMEYLGRWSQVQGLSWGRAELVATPPSHLFTLLGLLAHLGKGPS